MSTVIPFRNGAIDDVQTILDKAADSDLELAVVLGYTRYGGLFLGTTSAKLSDLFLLHRHLGNALDEALDSATSD
jgi:hypothetical protein